MTRRRRANAGEGYGYMFHGAFAEKKDAQKKERATKGAWIKPTWYKTGLRYVVMSPRTNPIKRKRKKNAAGGLAPVSSGRMRVFFERGLKKYTATKYHPTHGNLFATGYTRKEAAKNLRDQLRELRRGNFVPGALEREFPDREYQLVSVKPKAANPTELVVMAANPHEHEREITVPPGTTITIRTNPTNPLFSFHPSQRGSGSYRAPGLLQSEGQRRVAGMVRRARGRGRSHASADVKRDVIAALEGQGYRRSDAKRAVASAAGEDFGALFRDAQSRIRGNPRELCGAMVGGEPCSRKPGHRGPHLPQGATLRPRSRLRRGWHPRDNPNEAADLRETFVGREPNEVISGREPHMPAGDYAQLGELLTLYVKPRTGGQVQKITPNVARRPIVVSDTSARQIWFVGGDQDVSGALNDFGAAARTDGRLELGEARRIDYKQRKEHVPEPDLDEWRHEFGQETGARPLVIFDPTCKRLLLEGGAYEIRPEGIVN